MYKVFDICKVNGISSSCLSNFVTDVLCGGRPDAFKTLMPRKNARHFADDIFKCIFLNKKVWIFVTISLKFIPKSSINNEYMSIGLDNGLTPIRRPTIIWTNDSLICWSLYASLGLNKLRTTSNWKEGIMLWDGNDTYIRLIQKKIPQCTCSISHITQEQTYFWTMYCGNMGQVHCEICEISLFHHYHEDVIKWKHFPRYWLCAGNSPVTGEFTAQRPVTRSFDVFFDLRLIKWRSKHSWGWWFKTPSRPLWRHCNDDCHSTIWLSEYILFTTQWEHTKKLIVAGLSSIVIIYILLPT